ncbi:TIGR02594 family protein [Rhizobium sp. RU35A]|uniref:phage tail length tape measure family protein n=1 Tax=Rhizobium sp. RU35A TaxID=1907414 RepID=UPI0009558728|nr:phage tail length tape measure family protein [Rhizobium sp. RU35A]SIR16239.1 TIGR02594 family protein [Rhizobium sp. RU35A]
MTTPLKLQAVVTLDASQVPAGARATKAEIAGIGTEAQTTTSRLQALINAQMGLGAPAANQNVREWTGALVMQGRSLDELRAKHNPLFAVINQYKTQLTEIRTLHAQGVLSTDEMTAAISRQRQATLASIDVIKGRNRALGDSDGTAQFRRQNLTYQAFDVGQSLAGGMPIGMVLAQQGPQIVQIYAGQGGVNAALKDLGSIASGAARLITPLTVSIAGLAAVAVTGAAAWSSYLQSTKEVETAAKGLGLAVAGTSAEMEASARAGASAAGISVSAARSMEAGFLRTGRIGSENFEKLIAISKDFGATIGLDAASAGDALAEMFADPAKAAQTLYQQYGLITAATARQATNLAQQNRASEAQAVLLDALPKRLVKATDATTALGRAWSSVATFASDAYDSVGQIINKLAEGPTLEEQIARAQARFDGLSQSWRFDPARLALPDAKSDLDSLLAEKQRRDAEAARQKEQAEQIARSRAVTNLIDTSSAGADRRRIQTLQNEIATLRDGAKLTGINEDERTSTLDAKQRVLDSIINRQQRLTELDRLDIQIQSERNPMVRADLEARRTRLQMADQEVSTTSIEIDAGRARNRVIAETISTARAQAQDMQAELEVRTRLNALVAAGTITSADANRMLQEELYLRPLIAAAATAEEGAKQNLNQQITDLRAGYAGLAEQEKLASGQDYLRSQNERMEQLRVEQALIGANATVRARSLALLEAEQKIRQMGLGSDSNQARDIRAAADAMAIFNREIEKQADAWGKVQGSAENAIDGIVDGLSSGDISGALEGIAKDIKSTFLEIGVKNPLKNALLGTDYGTLSDIGGLSGIVGRLFGQKQSDPSAIVSNAMGRSVGSMSVMAGTVVINGGIGSGVGGSGVGNLLGGAANSNVPGGYSGLAGNAVDKAMGLIGANELSQRTDINAFLRAGGVDIDAATTAWCAGFVNSALKQVGIDGTGSLTANAFQNWGRAIDPSQLMRGDILLQTRGLGAGNTGGHVGFATGASRWLGGQQQFQMLSGNQQDSVTTSWINASELQIRRATEASASLASLAGTSGAATQNLGVFGNGLGQLANGLGQIGNIAATGGASSGGFFSSLLGGIGKLFGGVSPTSSFWAPNTTFGSFLVRGFSSGGATGGSDPTRVAGLVHEKEYVFDEISTAAIGVQNLDALRRMARGGGRTGFASGGYVASIAPVYANANSNMPSAANAGGASGTGGSSIVINNYGQERVRAEERTDERGRKQTIVQIGEATAAAIAQPGNPTRRTLQTEFGLKPRRINR